MASNNSIDFLSLRSQIQNWTLQSDQNLFQAIQKFSTHILQTQKQLENSIQNTKKALIQNQSQTNKNYNHFLRLSQFKFTQNKIAQKQVKIQNNVSSQVKQSNTKSKMDIFKQAIQNSMMNLQIKQQQKEADNVSMSQVSLSQAIFKNTKIPALFGTNEYKKTKFLNLFYDQQLVQSRRTFLKKEYSIVQNNPTSPHTNQNIGQTTNVNQVHFQRPQEDMNLNVIQSNISNSSNSKPNLAPPPPLNTVLNNSSKNSNNNNKGGSLPLPPPPPPLTISPPPLNNSNLPLIPNLTLTIPSSSSANQSSNQFNVPVSQKSDVSIQNQTNVEIRQQPQQKIKRSLSVQQQLALRLKQGKNYKMPVQQAPQPKINNNQLPLPIIRQRIESQDKISDNLFRASKNLDQLLKDTNPFQKKQNLFEEEEQQENSIFGPSKTRVKDKLLNKVNTVPIGIKIDNTSNQNKEEKRVEQQNIMSRQTFNQNILLKKPALVQPQKVNNTLPVINKSNLVSKPVGKKNQLFGQSDEQDQDPLKNLRRRNTSKVQIKKPALISNTKQKKPVNKLFEEEEDEDDIFSKKTRTNTSAMNFQKKTSPLISNQVVSKVNNQPIKQQKINQQIKIQQNKLPEQNKNIIIVQKKQQPISLPTVPKIQKLQTKQKPKKSLFDDQDDDQFNFSSKKKPAVKQQPVQPINIPPKNQKEINFQTIVSQNTNSSANQPQSKKPFILQNRQSTQSIKSVNKMAAIGGQAMLPMMLPGMQITKPSQAKKMQEQAMRKMKQNKERQQRQQKQRLQKQKKQRQQIQQAQRQRQKVQIQQKNLKQETQKYQRQSERLPQVRVIQQKQKKQIIILKQPQIIAKKQDIKIQQKPILSLQQQDLTLKTRKKKKPTKAAINFDNDQQIVPSLPIISKQNSKPNQNYEKQEIKTNQTVQIIKQEPQIKKSSNPLQKQISNQNVKTAMKFANAYGGPNIPVLPTMNAGMIKPSQAKRLQEQAIQRQKKQQQEKLRIQKQLQQQQQLDRKLKFQELQRQRLRRQQEVLQEQRLRRIQQAQQLEILRKKQAQQLEKQRKQEQAQILLQRKKLEQQKIVFQRRKFQQQQRRQYQQQQRRQYQQQQRRQYQQQQRRRYQEEQRRQLQQQQRRIRQAQAYEKQIRQAQQEERKRKAQLPQFNKINQPLQQERKPNNNPLGFVPKMPSRNPLGGNVMSEKPSIQPLPIVPKVTQKTTHESKKVGLFGQSDQDQPKIITKQQPVKTNLTFEKKKGGLFDDDQDNNQDFKFKPQSKKPPQMPVISNTNANTNIKNTNTNAKKKTLFDDDEDEGDFFKPAKKEQIKNSLPPPVLKNNPPIIANTNTNKISSTIMNQPPISQKRKNLFGEEDQQQQFKMPVSQKPKVQVIETKAAFEEQNYTKRNLFEDSDSQGEQVLKKKRQAAKKLHNIF